MAFYYYDYDYRTPGLQLRNPFLILCAAAGKQDIFCASEGIFFLFFSCIHCAGGLSYFCRGQTTLLMCYCNSEVRSCTFCACAPLGWHSLSTLMVSPLPPLPGIPLVCVSPPPHPTPPPPTHLPPSRSPLLVSVSPPPSLTSTRTTLSTRPWCRRPGQHPSTHR